MDSKCVMASSHYQASLTSMLKRLTKVTAKIVFLRYVKHEDDFLVFRCVDCNKRYEKEFGLDLSKIFEDK